VSVTAEDMAVAVKVTKEPSSVGGGWVVDVSGPPVCATTGTRSLDVVDMGRGSDSRLAG
jgi:hypothetical protein